MADNDNQTDTTQHVSIRLPKSMVRKIDEAAGKYRDRTSIIMEAVDQYFENRRSLTLETIAQSSEEYKDLIARLRRDLGLPDQSSGEG
jgi:predicted transcriptional regulator